MTYLHDGVQEEIVRELIQQKQGRSEISVPAVSGNIKRMV